MRANSHLRVIVRYVSVFVGASWPLFSPAYISLVRFAAWAALSILRREGISHVEWFCIAECGLILATPVLPACGRLRYGVSQAIDSRYQMPAMIYWASLRPTKIAALVFAVMSSRRNESTSMQLNDIETINR